jgi:hypothetical protein
MAPIGPTDSRHAAGDWWVPVAVGSGIVVALALAAALLIGQRGDVRTESAAPLSSRIDLAARAALVALGSDETEFETARAELLEVLDARGESLPADTRSTVTENLEIIESQIEAISQELERDPENQRLAKLLAAAYQRELELLQHAAALPSAQPDTDS